MTTHQPDLNAVDWSQIPAPADDGAADHLAGMRVPPMALASTAGALVDLAALSGRSVVYAYPRTGTPEEISPVEGWDMIPGARGCTPQACGFRDHFADLHALGVTQVFGLSTQTTAYQAEMAARLHLPFPILSDEALAFTQAARLPTFEAGGMTLLRRLTMIIDAGVITRTLYPVFPPDRSAQDVMAALRDMPSLP
ncbi:MAG: peroxiredoxin [Pseudomonadota bacterium]